MNSTKLTNLILDRHGSRPDLRLWRNETAGAWVGKKEGSSSKGDVIFLRSARFIQAGLGVGSADLVGVKMVSNTVDTGALGVFVALEVKTGDDHPTKDQRSFLAAIESLGGIAGVVRSVEDADRLLGPPPSQEASR